MHSKTQDTDVFTLINVILKINMKKIVSIVGARPQFIKACPLSLELRKHFKEVIVHTGQHYDYGMSDIFFKELSISKPNYNLGVGSGHHGSQTAAMLVEIEKVLIEEKPSLVIVYGDTNSTLASALAAVKMNIPVAHIEAGMRSFNRRMPEEINRVLTDHISQWLFVPSEIALRNLGKEGITRNVHIVGDIMYDSLLLFSEVARTKSTILDKLRLSSCSYCLSTVHRAENTDDPFRLKSILSALSKLEKQVVLPLHPRTLKKSNEYGLKTGDNVRVIEPLGYLDMLHLIMNADCVITDSGGLQKEAYYLSVPCVSLRDETEWVETIETGWNILAGASTEKIIDAARKSDAVRTLPHPKLYGDGTTARKITDVLLKGT